MRRENDSFPQYNLENPLYRHLHPCKAIAPKNLTGGTGGKDYSVAHPRIVKSDFCVPANWQVVAEYTNGQSVLDENGHRITQEYLGEIQTLVHVCQKPYNCLSDTAGGFYADWQPSYREIDQRHRDQLSF
jgi:hypothetical protein